MRRGVYPGSFNPPTIAHLAIAGAAVRHHRLDELVFTLSTVALGKTGARGPTVDERARVLRESVGHLSWAAVAVTDVQLIADIADGFDLVVMGADKWAQVNDPTFYDESVAARDHALARLPELAIAPRPPVAVPAAMQLDVPAWAAGVSSSRARAGEGSLMTPEARRSGLWAED